MMKKIVVWLIGFLIMLTGTTVWAHPDYSHTESGGEITLDEYLGSGGDVVIPDTIDGFPVVAIGEGAFSFNDGVTSVTIPDSVTTIVKDAFQNCDGLRVATIGDGVTSIGDSAFRECDALVRVDLGASVTTIGRDAFEGTALISLIIPDSVTSIGQDAFKYCRDLARVYLGNSVSSIGDGAFHYCDSLTSISIPASVTSIESYAFSDTDSLSVAYFLGDAPTMGSNVFNDTAVDFNICYTSGAAGFTTPDWEGYPASACACSADTDCSEDEECTQGVCAADEAPVLADGPFLAAGSWPSLPTDADSPMNLDQNYSVLWTFSDDYAFCPELCTHTAEYKVPGDSTWTSLSVRTDDTAEWYAYVDLPVASLQNATTYALQLTVTDCAGQSTQSAEYYFRVVTEDNPPVLGDGPFLAAGSWPSLPKWEADAMVLDQNYDVLWTFSDDYASCGNGSCAHRARYAPADTPAASYADWVWLDVTANEAAGYAYAELPVASLAPGTYKFHFAVTDCLGQSTSSNHFYYFTVEE